VSTHRNKALLTHRLRDQGSNKGEGQGSRERGPGVETNKRNMTQFDRESPKCRGVTCLLRDTNTILESSDRMESKGDYMARPGQRQKSQFWEAKYRLACDAFDALTQFGPDWTTAAKNSRSPHNHTEQEPSSLSNPSFYRLTHRLYQVLTIPRTFPPKISVAVTGYP
jgi:hypothetical protein